VGEGTFHNTPLAVFRRSVYPAAPGRDLALGKHRGVCSIRTRLAPQFFCRRSRASRRGAFFSSLPKRHAEKPGGRARSSRRWIRSDCGIGARPGRVPCSASARNPREKSKWRDSCSRVPRVDAIRPAGNLPGTPPPPGRRCWANPIAERRRSPQTALARVHVRLPAGVPGRALPRRGRPRTPPPTHERTLAQSQTPNADEDVPTGTVAFERFSPPGRRASTVSPNHAGD